MTYPEIGFRMPGVVETGAPTLPLAQGTGHRAHRPSRAEQVPAARYFRKVPEGGQHGNQSSPNTETRERTERYKSTRITAEMIVTYSNF